MTRLAAHPAVQFLLLSLIWGSTWFAITTQINDVPPGWSVCYRFAIAGLAMFALAVFSGAGLQASARQHVLLMLLGVLQFSVNFFFVYEAERHIPSGLVAVVFVLMVVTNPLLGWLLLGQPVRRPLVIGAALAISGIVLVFWREIEAMSWADAGLRGVALALCGVAVVSLGNQLPATRALVPLPLMAVNAWGMVYGACASACLAFWLSGPPQISSAPAYWAGLLYLALLGSVVTFSLYFSFVRARGVGQAAYVSVAVPLVALGVSTLLEGYRWTLPAGLGVWLAIGGTLYALRGRRA